MPERESLQDRLLGPVVPFRDRVVAWMDPISMKPEERRGRRRFVITAAVVFMLLFFVATALTTRHAADRCPKAPDGAIVYDVPNATSVAHANTRELARSMFAKYPQAREIDFCAADDGTVLQRFLSNGHH